jgi:hypothetical protein
MMGRRWYDDYPEWMRHWNAPHMGRFWKRHLAKALRRCARAECYGRRQRLSKLAIGDVKAAHGRREFGCEEK